MAKHPWDRRKGEPEDIYKKFLIFRNLGPSRTIARAFAEYKGVQDSTEVQASGPWKQDAADWEWIERANAWDIHTLYEAGAAAAAAYVHALREAAVRALDALMNPKLRPKTWAAFLETIRALGNLIPPELYAVPAGVAEPPGETGGGQPAQPRQSSRPGQAA